MEDRASQSVSRPMRSSILKPPSSFFSPIPPYHTPNLPPFLKQQPRYRIWYHPPRNPHRGRFFENLRKWAKNAETRPSPPFAGGVSEGRVVDYPPCEKSQCLGVFSTFSIDHPCPLLSRRGTHFATPARKTYPCEPRNSNTTSPNSCGFSAWTQCPALSMVTISAAGKKLMMISRSSSAT